ncbi:MAG: hypothetical protein GY714_23895 [Desulfobacterales bacterium]|nr:hypothetical protein [Desulfobacterales bacterium]MCP4160916.1 hypothetical protein [Deltaproteobacteria bacterium]
MTQQELLPEYHEKRIYHGCTTIEIIRKRSGRVIKRDWLQFNTVQEAKDYFFNELSE